MEPFVSGICDSSLEWIPDSAGALHVTGTGLMVVSGKKSPFCGLPQKGDRYRQDWNVCFVIYVIVPQEKTTHKRLKSWQINKTRKYLRFCD